MMTPTPLDIEDGCCPSCGGLNLSCPAACGRDPETGELDGSTLHSAPTPSLVDRVWEALKSRCCADPAQAKRCVMVGKEDLAAAISNMETSDG